MSGGIASNLAYIVSCICCSIIRNFEGSLVMKYQHPDAVYGCDWSPHNAYVIIPFYGSVLRLNVKLTTLFLVLYNAYITYRAVY